jgi:hypothetical protein
MFMGKLSGKFLNKSLIGNTGVNLRVALCRKFSRKTLLRHFPGTLNATFAAPYL